MDYQVINTTLEEIILESPKEYKEFDIYAFEDDSPFAPIYWMGSVSSHYDLYAGEQCSYVNEDSQEIWLKRTCKELDGRD